MKSPGKVARFHPFIEELSALRHRQGLQQARVMLHGENEPDAALVHGLCGLAAGRRVAAAAVVGCGAWEFSNRALRYVTL